MADILSQEEIDALLDVVDDSECYYEDQYPFWALSKFNGEFTVKEYTAESIDDILKTLDIYNYDRHTSLYDFDLVKVTSNNSFSSISNALKDVGYHFIIVGSSERNITSRLREEQAQREFLIGVDKCIDNWIEDHPQHLI